MLFFSFFSWSWLVYQINLKYTLISIFKGKNYLKYFLCFHLNYTRLKSFLDIFFDFQSHIFHIHLRVLKSLPDENNLRYKDDKSTGLDFLDRNFQEVFVCFHREKWILMYLKIQRFVNELYRVVFLYWQLPK